MFDIKKYNFVLPPRPHPEQVHAETMKGFKPVSQQTGGDDQNVIRLSKISEYTEKENIFQDYIFLNHTHGKPGRIFSKHLGRYLHQNNSISLGHDHFEIKNKKKVFLIKSMQDFDQFSKNNELSQRNCLQIVSKIYDLDGSLGFQATKLFGKMAIRSFDRSNKNWDKPVSQECIQQIQIFLKYFFEIQKRSMERCSLNYTLNAEYCLWSESDASPQLISYRVFLLEYSSVGSYTNIKILRKYIITKCDQCQVFIDKNIEEKCKIHQDEKFEMVCFQPLICETFLAPSKCVSLPMLELSLIHI